jgi:hypothetical protein
MIKILLYLILIYFLIHLFSCRSLSFDEQGNFYNKFWYYKLKKQKKISPLFNSTFVYVSNSELPDITWIKNDVIENYYEFYIFFPNGRLFIGKSRNKIPSSNDANQLRNGIIGYYKIKKNKILMEWYEGGSAEPHIIYKGKFGQNNDTIYVYSSKGLFFYHKRYIFLDVFINKLFGDGKLKENNLYLTLIRLDTVKVRVQPYW